MIIQLIQLTKFACFQFKQVHQLIVPNQTLALSAAFQRAPHSNLITLETQNTYFQPLKTGAIVFLAINWPQMVSIVLILMNVNLINTVAINNRKFAITHKVVSGV